VIRAALACRARCCDHPSAAGLIYDNNAGRTS
jgi:hypothetical protein